MNNSKIVDIVCILDQSGSMFRLTDDTIGGFNAFLKEQKELPGKARLTLALFSDGYDVIYDRVPLKDVSELDGQTYRAQGSTALLDAVGNTINSIRNSQKKKTPTIVLITTDGYENASIEYNKSQVKELVEKMTKKGWEFVFTGAGIDAFAEGGAIGIMAANTFAFAADSKGIAQTYDTMASSARLYRESVSKTGSS